MSKWQSELHAIIFTMQSIIIFYIFSPRVNSFMYIAFKSKSASCIHHSCLLAAGLASEVFGGQSEQVHTLKNPSRQLGQATKRKPSCNWAGNRTWNRLHTSSRIRTTINSPKQYSQRCIQSHRVYRDIEYAMQAQHSWTDMYQKQTIKTNPHLTSVDNNFTLRLQSNIFPIYCNYISLGNKIRKLFITDVLVLILP